jgi:hypothetical protein
MLTEGDAVAKGKKHKPFASKAQQKFFFVNPKLKRFAKAKAHATGEHGGTPASKAAYKRLPARKKARKR